MKGRIALLGAAVATAAAGLVGVGGSQSTQQIAQEAKAQAERQQDRQRAPASHGDSKPGLRSSSTTGGWRAPGVGGYLRRPRGSHKQNARIEAKRLRRQRGGAGLDLLAWALACAAAAFFALLIYAPLGALECRSKWGGSGMRTDYGLFSGCRVQAADGRWLPEDRVREVDVSRPAER